MTTLVTPQGVEHGLLRKLSNSVREDRCKREGAAKAEYEKQKKRDNEIIRARYINYKNRDNGDLPKPYVKYAGDPILVYRFLSGYVYDVPRGLVDEVNEAEMPKRSLDDTETKDHKPQDRKSVKVHEFVPVSF